MRKPQINMDIVEKRRAALYQIAQHHGDLSHPDVVRASQLLDKTLNNWAKESFARELSFTDDRVTPNKDRLST